MNGEVAAAGPVVPVGAAVAAGESEGDGVRVRALTGETSAAYAEGGGGVMQPLTVELPGPLRTFVEERAAAGGFATPEAFIREVLERERRNAERARVEALALEGLASGEPEESDDVWWAERYAELDRRLAADGEAR